MPDVFLYIFAFNPCNNPERPFSYFIEEETEALIDKVNSLSQSHLLLVNLNGSESW